MAAGPFGSEYEPVVWTGERMIAVDLDTGRTASYVPPRGRWREVSRAPRYAESFAPYVWTGSEFILAEVTDDGARLGGLAYRPDDDRWRDRAHGLDGQRAHRLVRAQVAARTTAPRWFGIPAG